MKKILTFLFFYYSAPSFAHTSYSTEIIHQLEHLIWPLIISLVIWILHIAFKGIKEKFKSF